VSNTFGHLLRVTTFGEPRAGDRVRDRRLPAGHRDLARRRFRADLERRATGARATPRSGARPTRSKSSAASSKAVTTGTPIGC
jgi:chorismate synthase